MFLDTIHGIIERRVLLNYRIAPDSRCKKLKSVAVVSGLKELKALYLWGCTEVHDRKTWRIEAPFACLSNWRTVVFMRRIRMLRAVAKSIEGGVLGESPFRIFFDYSLDNLGAFRWVLQFFERLDLANHPETRTIVKKSDPRRLFD